MDYTVSLSLDKQKILSVMQEVGKIESRIRFQKLFYILNEFGLGLNDNFYYHFYGPYSSDLQIDLNQLVLAGLLEEKEEPSKTGDFIKHAYQLVAEGGEASSVTLPDPLMKLAVMVNEIESSRTLELIATLMYLEKDLGSAEAAERKIKSLKSHIIAKLDEAKKLKNEMEEKFRIPA